MGWTSSLNLITSSPYYETKLDVQVSGKILSSSWAIKFLSFAILAFQPSHA